VLCNCTADPDMKASEGLCLTYDPTKVAILLAAPGSTQGEGARRTSRPGEKGLGFDAPAAGCS